MGVRWSAQGRERWIDGTGDLGEGLTQRFSDGCVVHRKTYDAGGMHEHGIGTVCHEAVGEYVRTARHTRHSRSLRRLFALRS